MSKKDLDQDTDVRQENAEIQETIESIPFEELAEDIRTLLDHKPFLDRVLPELYKSRLEGEQVTEPMAELAIEIPELAKIVAFFERIDIASETAVSKVATELYEEEKLSQSERNALQQFWKEHSWIEDLVDALIQRDNGYMYPTRQGVSVDYREGGDDPEFVSNWQAVHGADELWDITAPTPALIWNIEAVTRFHSEEINKFLDNKGGSLDLAPSDLEHMAEAADQLLEEARALRETVARIDEYNMDSMDDYRQFEQEFDQEASEALDKGLPDYEY